MTPIILFEFDNVISIKPKKPAKTMREICFRALPNATLKAGAKAFITNIRRTKIPVVMVAYEDEMFVKEAILAADLCVLFDKFIIIKEISNNFINKKEIIIEQITRQYGESNIYLYQPSDIWKTGDVQYLYKERIQVYQAANF